MIRLLTLLLAVSCAASAQTVDWNADPAARFGAHVAALRKKENKPKDDGARVFSSVPAPDSGSLTPEQLACQPDVIEGFKKIYAQAGSGSVDTEAGMRIDLVAGQRVIFIAEQTHQFKKMEIPLSNDTIAIAHTHPTNGAGAGQPSGQDETSPVPNFVISRWALWVTNPHPAKHKPRSRRLRYNDWMKPCQAVQ